MEPIHHLVGLGEDLGNGLLVGGREIERHALDPVAHWRRDCLAQGVRGGLRSPPWDDLKNVARGVGVDKRDVILPFSELFLVDPEQDVVLGIFRDGPRLGHAHGPLADLSGLSPRDIQQPARRRERRRRKQDINRMPREQLREMRAAPHPWRAQPSDSMLFTLASWQPAMQEHRVQANIQVPPNPLGGSVIARRLRPADRAPQRCPPMLHPNIHPTPLQVERHLRDPPRSLNANQSPVMPLKRGHATRQRFNRFHGP